MTFSGPAGRLELKEGIGKEEDVLEASSEASLAAGLWFNVFTKTHALKMNVINHSV